MATDIKIPFGKSVKSWRDKLGVSQEKLAEKAGLHRTYISDIERGARNVSLESIEKLARALEVSISALFSTANEHSSTPAPTSVPVRHISSDELVDILIVEDNADDVTITVHGLQAAKITNRIHVVHDGKEALDFLFCEGIYSNRRGLEQPQVVLLDLNLPKINGLEVLRQIKANPHTATIPVVVLTSSNRDRDIQTSKHLGAITYIVKPVDFQNLSQVTPQLSLCWALLKPANAVRL